MLNFIEFKEVMFRDFEKVVVAIILKVFERKNIIINKTTI